MPEARFDGGQDLIHQQQFGGSTFLFAPDSLAA
jgi:hypothetical protein